MKQTKESVLEFLDAAILAEREIYDLESAKARLQALRDALRNRSETDSDLHSSSALTAGTQGDASPKLKPYPRLEQKDVPSKDIITTGLPTKKSEYVVAIPTVIGAILGWVTGGGIFGVVIAGIIGYLVGHPIVWAMDASAKNKEREEHEAKREQVIAENQRLKSEYDAKIGRLRQYDHKTIGQLDTEISSLDDRIAALRENLNSFYDAGPVYDDYRNLPALCQFKQYFESGRFDHLEGTDGAYNQYELEVRLNLIVSTLVDISSKLDRIEQNQLILYGVVTDIDRGIKRLATSFESCIARLDDIAQQEELQSYYAQRSNNATEFLARVEHWNTSWADMPTQYRYRHL